MKWLNSHPSEISEGILVVEASADGVYQLSRRNRFLGRRYPRVIAAYRASCLAGKFIPGSIQYYNVSERLSIVFMCVRWTYHGENKPSPMVVSLQTKRCLDLLYSTLTDEDKVYSGMLGHNTDEWKLIQNKLTPNWTILTRSEDAGS